MSEIEPHVVGVDITMKTIRYAAFTSKGALIGQDFADCPSPFIPGALTVQICKDVITSEFLRDTYCLGISMPEGTLTKKKHIEKCSFSSGWENVPLVDWLELRLNKKVFLVQVKEFNSLKIPFHQYFPVVADGSLNSFIAAFMATEYFKDVDSLK